MNGFQRKSDPREEPGSGLIVGGFVPLTTIDFPGRLAAVVFCQGCPWRCPYCHNPHLRSRRADSGWTWSRVLGVLRARVGLLDGVVFSGGEPLVQPALGDAMAELRGLGFRVALHTGGVDPDHLGRVLSLVDWVGFDAKAPFDGYGRITGRRDSGDAARRSLRLLLDSGVDHEVRTTVEPSLLSADDLRAMAAELTELGVRRFVIQEARTPSNPPLATPRGVGSAADIALAAELATRFDFFEIRAEHGVR